MKTIGLIGGMSWESSAEYYRLVNEETRRHLGGMHSARIVPYSFDFADIDELPQAGAWERASGLLAEAARVLERAGAELLVLCTNTMHRLFDDIEAGVSVPFIHIADPTAEGVRAEGLGTLGLLARATRWRGISPGAGSRDHMDLVRSFPMNRTVPWSMTSSMASWLLELFEMSHGNVIGRRSSISLLAERRRSFSVVLR